MAPMADEKGAAADVGKVNLGRVQKVSKHNDTKRKINIILEIHHDINIMTYLLSNGPIFTAFGVY